jgi:hypothetical protein
MDKSKRFAKEYRNGLEVACVDGTTAVTQREIMSPGDAASWKAKKLHALTHMLTGEGFDAFGALLEEDQASVIEVIRDLAAEIAALTDAAQWINLEGKLPTPRAA